MANLSDAGDLRFTAKTLRPASSRRSVGSFTLAVLWISANPADICAFSLAGVKTLSGRRRDKLGALVIVSSQCKNCSDP